MAFGFGVVDLGLILEGDVEFGQKFQAGIFGSKLLAGRNSIWGWHANLMQAPVFTVLIRLA